MLVFYKPLSSLRTAKVSISFYQMNFSGEFFCFFFSTVICFPGMLTICYPVLSFVFVRFQANSVGKCYICGCDSIHKTVLYEENSLISYIVRLLAAVVGAERLFTDRLAYQKMLPEASEVGISVYDLTAKKPLYDYRAEKLSRPASTMKLLTAITALSRPDADEPFRTEVWHDGVIERDTLQGNLYVVGGFDPEFDSQAMDSLIGEVITFPFSVINGQVYGDVSMKDSLYWGHGWAWDDTCGIPAVFVSAYVLQGNG